MESALNRGFVTFNGEDLYKEIEKKIAVIAHGLIRNHGFIDGNKRIGVSVLIILLKINNIKIQYTQSELINLGLEIAKGTMNEDDIFLWINSHKDFSNSK
ncbi:type II toxin-antitoxin system death-on-curing family toxin [Clostridium acetireducens]|uniref:type II toxin-antitoxin system death-on-curing family toxin n=1 Tax=Clostridium acetireducens TaxID=76489 RepID=UPI00241F87F6|nr:type II toxin-antitoxin system death-on-curing family toxin [Clostridium acetireducens]